MNPNIKLNDKIISQIVELSRIYIIEPALHHEVLDSLIRICKDAKIKHINCVSSTNCRSYSDFKNANEINWINIENFDNQIQLKGQVFLITSFNASLKRFKKLFLENKIAAYIHNLNNFKRNYSEIAFNYRALFWELKDFYNNAILKDLSSSVDQFLLPYKVESKSKFKYLPFVYPQNSKHTCKTSQLTFTIPGVINPQLRDYSQIFGVLKRIDPKINTQIVLKLLGKPFNQNIKTEIDQCIRRLKNIKIEYSNSYIDQELYNSQMLESDYLILPIIEKIRYKSFF